jgi:hypothetical protein
MKFFIIGLTLFAELSSGWGHAQKLAYLSCTVPATQEREAEHFDFTLDEQNGTVSFFVDKANALNKEKAVFGPDTVQWTTTLPFDSFMTRTISRVTLTFTEDSVLAGIREHYVGSCKVVMPPKRQF